MAFWNKKLRTHTNAPPHWPAVQLDAIPLAGINEVAVGGQLAPLHAPPKSSLSFLHDFLYRDGILRVPILVEEQGLKRGVFVYSSEDANAAAHYAGARAMLKSRENIAAVYYGPEALEPTTPADVLQPIDTPLFSKHEPAPEARFALWWATPHDPLFSQSKDRVLLDRWFEALDGYGHLLFTAFVKDLALIEKSGNGTGHSLPSQPFMQPLSGPGHSELLLHASAPEGVFLTFDDTKTTAQSRHLLLTLLASFATQYRAAIDGRQVPARTGEMGLATWRRIRDDALAREAEGASGLTLHALSMLDSHPYQDPSAPRTEESRPAAQPTEKSDPVAQSTEESTEDRTAAPVMPDRPELDFVMDLVDRVVAPSTEESEESTEHGPATPVMPDRPELHFAIDLVDRIVAPSSAKNAEDRRAAPATPDRPELDFGMDLVDRIVARTKTRGVAHNFQQALEEPNVVPIIAVKAGGHTWERQVPGEHPEAVHEAAARALQDWPDAEIIAVVLDATIRENGVSTDILSVSMENRLGVAAGLIQRYTTSASGEIELVGRPTVSPADSFLLPYTAERAPPVDPEVVALAAHALDQFVETLTFIERSGMTGDDPDAPLMSPSALLGQAEGPPKTMRFMWQGPLTAAMSCFEAIRNEPPLWFAYVIDDLMMRDSEPDRRLRLCVQRRGDPATAIFDQRYEPPVIGKAFARRGGLEFKRWVPSSFPQGAL